MFQQNPAAVVLLDLGKDILTTKANMSLRNAALAAQAFLFATTNAVPHLKDLGATTLLTDNDLAGM